MTVNEDRVAAAFARKSAIPLPERERVDAPRDAMRTGEGLVGLGGFKGSPGDVRALQGLIRLPAPSPRWGEGDASTSHVKRPGTDYSIDWPVFAQSATKLFSPLSVSGCLMRPFSVAGGTVATSAPISAASRTWFDVRIEAARISVSKP